MTGTATNLVPWRLFQNEENRFFKDRRLRADGSIIRAQAMIGTDGSTVRAGLCKTCALRAPTSFSGRINGIRAENEVLINNKDSVGHSCEIATLQQRQARFKSQCIGLPIFRSCNYRTARNREMQDGLLINLHEFSHGSII